MMMTSPFPVGGPSMTHLRRVGEGSRSHSGRTHSGLKWELNKLSLIATWVKIAIKGLTIVQGQSKCQRIHKSLCSLGGE